MSYMLNTQWGYRVDNEQYAQPFMNDGVELSTSEQAALEIIRNYCGWHITKAVVDYRFTLCKCEQAVALPFFGGYADSYPIIDNTNGKYNLVSCKIDGLMLKPFSDDCCSCIPPGNYMLYNYYGGRTWEVGFDFIQCQGLLAIIKQVAQALEQPANVVSEKAGSVAITYDNGKRSGILGERIKTLLSPYKIDLTTGW